MLILPKNKFFCLKTKNSKRLQKIIQTMNMNTNNRLVLCDLTKLSALYCANELFLPTAPPAAVTRLCTAH